MGFWDYISSTTDSLKRTTPDLTPVKNLYRTSCHYTSATVSKVDHAVRVNTIEKLNHHLPDQEARTRFAISLAKNAASFACHEGFKYLPGGEPLYRIASKSLGDVDEFEDPNKEIKMLKSKVDKLEEEVSACRKLLEQSEMHKQNIEFESQNKLHFDSNVVYQKPEDVIRVFMMKEFIGNRYLDDLIVPGVRSRKKLR